ncbi:MAG TPA: hypothetical protein DIT04_12810 [Dysgonomonas sp.]|nr:hypothetical protein [Dysgonomonas sp.]
MKKQTFSILFLIKPNKLLKTGETPIIMRLTLTGKRVEIQLKRRIIPKNWSQAKEKAIGKDPISAEINKYLESIRTRIYQIERDIEDDNLPLTLHEIKDRFDGKKSKANNCKMLFEVFQAEIDRMELLIDKDYAKITVGRYKLCLLYLKEMFQTKVGEEKNKKKSKQKPDIQNVQDIPMKDLDNYTIKNFETYLKTERKLSGKNDKKDPLKTEEIDPLKTVQTDPPKTV